MRSISLAVEGTPIPQGSKNVTMMNGKVILREGADHAAADRHATWRQLVRIKALNAQRDLKWEPVDEPAYLYVEFVMPRPASRSKDIRHAIAPDLDKLVRAVGDSLKGSLISDDSRISELHATKRYCVAGESPHCNISLRTFSDD